MNILVLLTSNEGSNSNEVYPVSLSDIDGSPLIEHLIKQIKSVKGARHIFAMYQQHIKKYHLSEVVKLLIPDAKIYKINNNPEGNACTALMSWGYLDKDQPLLILGANTLVREDINRILSDFMVRDLDGGVVVFHSIHPRHAYVRLDEDDLIEEAADRRPISQNACAEFYFFRKAGIFLDAAQSMIRKDIRSDGHFPLAPIFNQMLLKQMRIGAYPIVKEQFIVPAIDSGH
jgi:dTDP-glucose pyrophosphorylase